MTELKIKIKHPNELTNEDKENNSIFYGVFESSEYEYTDMRTARWNKWEGKIVPIESTPVMGMLPKCIGWFKDPFKNVMVEE